MNPYMHTTDLFRLLSCPRLAWQSHEHFHQPAPYANCQENFQELTTSFLHMDDLPIGRVGDNLSDTLRLLQANPGGRHLRLEHAGVRTQIPVLMAIGGLFLSPAWFENFQKEHAPDFGYAILDYKPDVRPSMNFSDASVEDKEIQEDEIRVNGIQGDDTQEDEIQVKSIHRYGTQEDEIQEELVQKEESQQADHLIYIPGSPEGMADAPDGMADIPDEAVYISGGNHKGVPFWQRKYAAIYPHLSKAPSNYEIPLLKLNQSLAKACGVDIVHHQTLYLDPEYVRKRELEPEQMLKISSRYFKKPGLPSTKTINQQLEKDETDLEEMTARGKEILYGPIPEPVKCRTCLAPRHCASYQECFAGQELPDHDPSFLFSSRQKKKIAAAGISDMKDLDAQTTDGFALQYAQIQAARNQGRFVDKQAVDRWIKGLSWPLIYLDFEWDTFAIPPYPGMKPFDVLCFQYSMHVEDEDGTLQHFNFFEGGDCRETFIQTLLDRIPKKGSIVVYNMEGAEKLRLIQLAEQFPAYASGLESVWSRMVDLSSLFEHGAVYDLSQRGRFSLKNVLPLFDEQNSYGQLDVQDGLQAIYAYREHESCPDTEKRKRIAESISRYCEMDTMAEVMILHGLKELEAKEQK